MKKIIAAAVAATTLMTAIFAGDEPVKSSAWFDLKTHTTIGYNFEEEIMGMESSLDQAQIWWEFMPYATRGVPAAETDTFQASVRIEGLKYAYKFFNSKNDYQDKTNGTSQPGDDFYYENPSQDNKASNYFDFERIVSEVTYNNFFAEFYNYDWNDGPVVGFNHASIKSLFDDFRNKHVFDADKDNNIGFLMYNGIKDTRNILDNDSSFGLTGIMSAGFRADDWNVRLSAGMPGSWYSSDTEGAGDLKQGKRYMKLNKYNQAVFQLDAGLSSIENLTLNASALATLNYSKDDDETVKNENTGSGFFASSQDIIAAGLSAEYNIATSSLGVIKPYLGMDLNYAKRNDKSDDLQLEFGAAVSWLWRGADYKGYSEVLDSWGRKFPVGVSLGMNVDQTGLANAVLSVFEIADKDALIPNLGGFVEVEAVNVAKSNDQDMGLFVAAQLEYMFNVPVAKRKIMGIKPYVFGRYMQTVFEGELTEKNPLDTRIGVIFYLCSRFTVDVRYERADVINTADGAENDLDKGCLTSCFSIKL